MTVPFQPQKISVPFVAQSVPIVGEDGLITQSWFDYFQDLHQLSGRAGDQNPLWETISVPGNSLLVDTASPPVQNTISGGIQAWSFITGAARTAHTSFCLPNSYVPGSEWYPFVQWMPDDATAGNVRWEFDYIAVADDGVAAAATQEVMTDAAAGTALTNQHIEPDDPLSGSGLDIGSVILCSITRNGADAADTYGGSAFLVSVGVKLMKSGIGTVIRWVPEP